MSYFEKIQQSDAFMILDNVQFQKGGYLNRFNVGEKFYTMSVNRGLDFLITKEYQSPERDWKKITDVFAVLKVFDKLITKGLLHTNHLIIYKILELLNIKTKIYSDFPNELKGSEKLVNICKQLGANKYLSGVSGRKYLDLSKFSAAGIEVIFQNKETMNTKPLVEIL